MCACCSCGRTPFHTPDLSVLVNRILNEPIAFPTYVSATARSLIEKLCDKNPKTRLGSSFFVTPLSAFPVSFRRLIRHVLCRRQQLVARYSWQPRSRPRPRRRGGQGAPLLRGHRLGPACSQASHAALPAHARRHHQRCLGPARGVDRVCHKCAHAQAASGAVHLQRVPAVRRAGVVRTDGGAGGGR